MLLKVTCDEVVSLYELAAQPAAIVPVSGSCTVDPETQVQLVPSGDVNAAKFWLPPESVKRVTFRYTGTAPGTRICAVCAPSALRHWTATPFDGVTNAA